MVYEDPEVRDYGELIEVAGAFGALAGEDDDAEPVAS